MTKQQILTKIDKEIDDIPPIPDNIEKIKQLIKDPKSEIQHISALVKLDPALTMDILRIANSAMYKTRTRAETIDRAITVIGMRELSSIIMTIAAKKILEEHYLSMEEVWKHSVKCAFYAQQLARIKNFPNLKEIAYTAGLLHDIGKLIFLTTIPGILDRIESLSEARNISTNQIERLALGITHGEIGSRITEKWNFPNVLVSAIAYHHNPVLAREEDKALVFLIYLANELSHVNEVQGDMMINIEPKVLEFFDIDTEETLDVILQSLLINYEETGNIH